MSRTAGRKKIEASYARWLQKNTWQAMVALCPEIHIASPNWEKLSIRKAWDYLDQVEKQYGIKRSDVERITRNI